MRNNNYLCHYTSQKGLLGILKQNKLWMTDILYLNDSSEYFGTVKMVKAELINYEDTTGKKKSLGPMLIEINMEQRLSANSSHPYIFSLSENKDDINQFRGYSPSIAGFCIEFDKTKLIAMVREKEGYKIQACIYNRTEIIKSIFSNKADQMSTIMNFVENSAEFPFFKDEAFKTEKEYRIVYSGKSAEIKYREGKSMIIPYIEFPPEDADVRLPITRIVVAPTPHPALSKLSVLSLLKSKGYPEEVEVEESAIPYRSW